MILVINESYENNEAFSFYENDFNYTSSAGDSNELKQFRVVKAWNSVKRTHTSTTWDERRGLDNFKNSQSLNCHFPKCQSPTI